MTSTKNTTRTARLFTLLLTLMLIGSTAACTQEPVEYFTPPPSTPTPTPVVDDVPEVFERPDIRTIEVPQYPQAANEVSEDGARAFAHYFLDILNYTAATGDVTYLEKFSGPECNACQGFIDATKQSESNGHWVEGFNASYASEPILVEDTGVAFALSITYQSDAYEVWSLDGKVRDFDALGIDGAIVIYRLGNYWLVEEFGEMEGL